MRWGRRAVAVAGIVAVLAVVGRYGGTLLVVEWPLDRPDIIVSLASHEWERLPETARWASRYPDARVVLTRPAVVSDVNCHDCERRVERLVRLGVPPGRIVVLPPLFTRGTYGEARAVLKYATEAGMRRVLIVTSPYHTRRALGTFRRVFLGLSIQIGIEPVRGGSQADPRRWWRTAEGRWYVRYEWLANVYYAVRFGVDPRMGAGAAATGARTRPRRRRRRAAASRRRDRS